MDDDDDYCYYYPTKVLYEKFRAHFVLSKYNDNRGDLNK